MKYSHPPLHLKTSSTLQHQYVNYDTLVATNEGLKQPNHRNKTFFKHNIETKFLSINFWEKEHILYVYSCIHILLYIQQTFCFANCEIKQ